MSSVKSDFTMFFTRMTCLSVARQRSWQLCSVSLAALWRGVLEFTRWILFVFALSLTFLLLDDVKLIIYQLWRSGFIMLLLTCLLKFMAVNANILTSCIFVGFQCLLNEWCLRTIVGKVCVLVFCSGVHRKFLFTRIRVTAIMILPWLNVGERTGLLKGRE